MKGSYLLTIKLEKNETISAGKLGNLELKKGFYVYIGSALNGLEQRINRHLRKNKKIHWHIDYLLQNAEIIDVFYKENKNREECLIAKTLDKKLNSIPNFGCSDCNCNSHLFYGTYKEIIDAVNTTNMKAYPLNEKS